MFRSYLESVGAQQPPRISGQDVEMLKNIVGARENERGDSTKLKTMIVKGMFFFNF